MRKGAGRLALAMLVLLLAACTREPQVHFHADGLPQRLSDWGVLQVDAAQLRPTPGVLAYDLNTPLFSDYAYKLRTVWLPPGQAARYSADQVFDFPVGTILSKTFYYHRAGGGEANAMARESPQPGAWRGDRLDLAGVRLIETRLLVRRENGWIALPYVWNAAQTEASLSRIGALIPLQLVAADGQREPVAYQVPDQNQCAGCHAVDNKSRQLQPIGPKARHLNRDFAYADGSDNQLARWTRLGLLQGSAAQPPRAADWRDGDAPLQARARSYLDINCGHCHSPTGAANTSGLWLDAATPDGLQLGLCKLPVAAGKGTGDRRFDIWPGAAERSVLQYRLESTDPSAMMPELGRSVVHREGAQLIRAWIDAQTGTCGM